MHDIGCSVCLNEQAISSVFCICGTNASIYIIPSPPGEMPCLACQRISR